MTDRYDLCNPMPTLGKPTAVSVTFRRDRADRFSASASTKGWWFEQDPARPYADRFREFVRLYESGFFRARLGQ